MGIRMTQVYGLNEAAQSLINGEGEHFRAYSEEVTRRYADGVVESSTREGSASTVISEESGLSYQGMFEGEEYPLLRYRLPSGRVLEEREYASPWASGPCIFLALVEVGADDWRPADDEDYHDYGRRRAPWVRETLWTDREIAESI